MNPRKNRIAFFFAILLSVQLFCLPAAAFDAISFAPEQPQYVDVYPGSAYYDAVYALSREQILFGVSADSFAPSVPVTARQVVVTANRLLGLPDTPDDYYGELADLAVTNKLIPYGFDFDAALTHEQAVNILFRSLGCMPACNTYDNPIYDEADGFDFALNILDDLNLLDKFHIDPSRRGDIITRGEYAILLYDCFQMLADELYGDILTTCGFGYIPVEATGWFERYIDGTVGYLINIPFRILKTYHNSEYGILLDNERTKLYSQTHSDYANRLVVGLFVPTDKKIYITQPFAVVHEMGHFVERFMVGVGDIESCYKKEKDAAADLLGEYALLNHREYFGEAFRFFVLNRDDVIQMDLMRGVMPQTYQYFLDLESHNFIKNGAN